MPALIVLLLLRAPLLHHGQGTLDVVLQEDAVAPAWLCDVHGGELAAAGVARSPGPGLTGRLLQREAHAPVLHDAQLCVLDPAASRVVLGALRVAGGLRGTGAPPPQRRLAHSFPMAKNDSNVLIACCLLLRTPLQALTE